MPAEAIVERRASARDRDRDDRATISVFATVAASMIAALYYAGRWGFDNPARPVLATLGLSLFITVAPFIVWRLSVRGYNDESQPWWRSQPALTIAALAITSLAGMLVPATSLNVVGILAAIGYGSALAVLVIWITQGSQRTNFHFMIGSAAFAVWACGVAWSTRYKTPVFWEALEHNRVYKVTVLCEPHLGGRGFYPTLGSRGIKRSVRSVTNVLAYADGTRDLVDVATHIGVSAEEVVEIAERLSEAGLLEIEDS